MLGKKTFLFAVGVLILGFVYALTVEQMINKFTNSVYPIFSKYYVDGGGKEETFMISPVSINMAYNMYFLGAAFATKSQIGNALKAVPNTFLSSPAYTTQLTNLLSGLTVNSMMFYDQGSSLNPAYVTSISTVLGANVQSVPFEDIPEDAATTISNWVNGGSQGLITDIITKLDITQNTIRCLAVTTIYFNGQWLYPFTIEQGSFTTSTGGTNQVDMLTRKATVYNGYDFDATSLDATAVELKYATPGLSLVIILPKPTSTLAKLEAKLKVADWTSIFVKIRTSVPKQGDVTIPSFTADTISTSKSLNFMLQLGATNLFSNPDLSNMFVSQPPLGVFSLHRTVIVVDDTSTTVAQTRKQNLLRHRAALPMVANRPFVFVLKKADTVISIGRYTGI